MFTKKNKDHATLNDLKKANNELEDLLKELRKEAKSNKNSIALQAINEVDLDLDYRSILMQSLTGEQIDNEITLTTYIRSALLDSQELLRKGTEYGVQLSLTRVNEMLSDRRVAKSAFLVEQYNEFEKNLWNIVKLRELAYGEITRLKKKQDNITRTALTEADSMMRVRYFEDIRVLEKDILRLENEAHDYDTVQVALHSDEVLKGVFLESNTQKKDLIEINEFKETVNKYGGKN